ncbi:MAG: dTMP kinase [Actinomycetes bacterium]
MTKSVSNYPGFFIVFEGGDGAGKSTQVKKLEQSLKDLNETVILSREPGGTALGLKIREILLDQTEYEVTPRMEALLFAADRSINMSQVIKPALEKGHVVIADRHIDSSIAYQGISRGLGEQTIEDISRWAVQGIVPDLTIVLDVTTETGQSRLKQKDRLDRESEDFHNKVNKAYLDLAKKDPARYVVIDASKPVEEIAKLVLDAFLAKRKK